MPIFLNVTLDHLHQWEICVPLWCSSQKKLKLTFAYNSAGDRLKIPKWTISDKKFTWAANYSGDFFLRSEWRPLSFIPWESDRLLFLKVRIPRPTTFRHARQCQTPCCSNCEAHGVAWIKQPLYSPDFNFMDRYIFRNWNAPLRENFPVAVSGQELWKMLKGKKLEN